MIDEPDGSVAPDALVSDDRLVVAGFDAEPEVEVDLEALCRVAVEVLRGEGLTEARVDLHLVDRATITELNRDHLGVDGPTDVLAFPLDPDPFSAPGDEPPMVGDVVLCPSVAAAQAGEHAGTPAAEFALLTIHGVLHLLGHDHADPVETALMQAGERRHLADLGFSHPVPAPTDAVDR